MRQAPCGRSCKGSQTQPFSTEGGASAANASASRRKASSCAASSAPRITANGFICSFGAARDHRSHAPWASWLVLPTTLMRRRGRGRGLLNRAPAAGGRRRKMSYVLQRLAAMLETTAEKFLHPLLPPRVLSGAETRLLYFGASVSTLAHPLLCVGSDWCFFEAWLRQWVLAVPIEVRFPDCVQWPCQQLALSRRGADAIPKIASK